MARIVAPVVCLLLSCLLKPARAEIDLEDCREDEYSCYVQSGHVAVDNEEYEDAFEWFSLAAQDDFPQGLDMVGISYQEGLGVAKDEEKAFEYYKKAAETGYDQGLFHLGACYSSGIGVEENQRLALKAWMEAAQLGHASSAFNIGLRYQAGTPPLLENKKVAMQFFHLAAEGGHLGAMFNMGVFLTFTKGSQQNHTAGCAWFQNVSETGQAPQYANDANVARAMVNLAMCYFTGEGMEHNVAEGVLLLEKAAKLHGEGADRAKQLISYGYERFKTPKRVNMPEPPINVKDSEVDLDELQKGAEPDIDLDEVATKPRKVYPTEL